MALRNIVLEGDEILRKRSKEVKCINDRVLELLDDMWETLKHLNGLGLAAPQVGMLKRIAIVDTGKDGERVELINPDILETSGEIVEEEACLSVPGVCGRVKRPERVMVQAANREGETFILEAEGLLAKAVSHEIDHLDGVLFVDRATEIRNVDDDYEDDEDDDLYHDNEENS